jgi:hypothetical protein
MTLALTRCARDIILSLRITSTWPYVARLSKETCLFSDRLVLITFRDARACARRYVLEKLKRRDGLFGDDTMQWVTFPKPGPSFRYVFHPMPFVQRPKFGMYRWGWTKDGRYLVLTDEMAFYLTFEEACALEKVIFDSKQT